MSGEGEKIISYSLVVDYFTTLYCEYDNDDDAMMMKKSVRGRKLWAMRVGGSQNNKLIFQLRYCLRDSIYNFHPFSTRLCCLSLTEHCGGSCVVLFFIHYLCIVSVLNNLSSENSTTIHYHHLHSAFASFSSSLSLFHITSARGGYLIVLEMLSH